MKKKLTDMTIHELDAAIYNALPEGYNTEVTDSVCLDDTIKVKKDGSALAMYIGWDKMADDVLNATIYDEHDPEEDKLIEEGIYWDTDEADVTAESIAEDIIKHI